MTRPSRTRFIGVNLGGGRGKNTAVARLERDGDALSLAEARLRHGHRGGGEDSSNGGDPLFRDDVLIAYLDRWVDEQTVVAIDAPLTLPPCIRCTLTCPGIGACTVPVVAWMREHAPALALAAGRSDRGKPAVTPYTQRAVDLLHTRAGLRPRESLGQGMGPLAARAAYLRRALAPRLRLHENLVEVHPPATVIRLHGATVEHRLRRADTETARQLRKRILAELPFGYHYVWPEAVVRSPHIFHAVVGAYTALLWADGQLLGPRDLADQGDEAVDRAVADLGEMWLTDGWTWVPRPPPA